MAVRVPQPTSGVRWLFVWLVLSSVIFGVIVFGLFHVNVVGATLFGIVMCVVYLHTRMLWIPIGMHVANNLLLTMSGWLPGQPSQADVALTTTEIWELLITGAVITIVSLGVLGSYLYWQWPGRKGWQLPPVQA